ncbi:MAG: hypothetical protein ACIWVG_18525, partial [Gloeotrichia echinulata HAB0833]
MQIITMRVIMQAVFGLYAGKRAEELEKLLVDNVKAVAATDCAKHRIVKAVADNVKAVAATDCAKHRIVK